ncbi:hypothetical protein [Streptomyces sp. NPDC004008]
MAVGAAVWGAVADAVGAVTPVSVAAVPRAVGSLIGYGFAVPDRPLDRTPSLHWAEPVMRTVRPRRAPHRRTTAPTGRVSLSARTRC